MRRRQRGAAAAALSALLLAGCAGGDGDGRTRLSVYAASSLTEAFGELARLFMSAHPGVELSLSFSGSQVLRVQIEEGAPADVFASANAEHMSALVEAGLASGPKVFARNELVVIVPVDNPSGLESFADLPRARRVVLGTEAAPVGRYARSLLVAADSLLRPGFRDEVLAHVVSEEPNVRLARAKVELGEADAAIVYRTDAAASDRVRTIPIPDGMSQRAEYLIGVVGRDGGSAAAEAWVSAVLSSEGRAVLSRHGFVVE